jgi:hypothetical protein
MPMRSRSPRVAVPGARIQFANTVAELINISPTGALIRMNFELRKGGEWPLVLEVPSSSPFISTQTPRQVWLHGRVVRCTRHDAAYILALSFVSPNEETLAVLTELCSAPVPVETNEKRPRPLPWGLPTFSFERLLRAHWSPKRECPECHSRDVSKERRHSYSCYQCGCRFNGFRIGRLRISL